ncbi:MAG: 4-hydroxy-3-methylbut-2-enyl diphosphate reductase [Desulfobacterales bacterium]|nr:4-hydroxy-3-methylbut-2-enyl diphosphate reductase [Desulfobacterales bacterium]
MKIILAQTAGFCMGVRRAVELVMEAPEQHDPPICTYGPLIHNPQVLELLDEKGITALDAVPDKGRGTVLVRAHGVPPEIKTDLNRAGYAVIDATCPRVIRVQTIIRKHSNKGYAVIIIGDRDHPEVIGLLGYAGEEGHVAASLAELRDLPPFEKAIVVAQTTQNTRTFEEIRAWVQAHRPHYKLFATICDSTEKRQAEVKCMAALVDAVVVVGGKDSGNTQRLFEIARATGKPAYHVETEEELDLEALSGMQCVGVSAGASTPNWQIRKVCRALELAPYRAAKSLRSRIHRLQRAIILTNVYLALGAGCLAYASQMLQMLPGSLRHGVVAMLYVLSMHLLNNLTGSDADRYNSPEREHFYARYKRPLAVLAFFSGAAGLAVSATSGGLPFAVLLVISLLGLSYNLHVLPGFLSGGRYRRIRDIPGSKTFLIAAAWGVVTALLPAMAARQVGFTTLLVMVWAGGIVFSRSAFFDLMDIQGDRLVGRETLPVLLGEKRAAGLIRHNILAMMLLLLAMSLAGLIPWLGYLLLLVPLSMAAVIRAHADGRVPSGARLEFLMESVFILAGVLGFVWKILR